MLVIYRQVSKYLKKKQGHERRIFGEKSIGEIKKNIFILNSDVKFSEKSFNKKLLTF